MIKKILIAIIILIMILAGLYVYAHEIEPRLLTVKQVSLPSGKNQASGLKIVFFSDTHIGKDYNISQLQKVATKINEQKPDLVIFGGDLIDNYNRDKPDLDQIISVLSLIQAEYGKFSVYGNHDYGGGANRIYGDLMEKSGFTLLTNQSVKLKDRDICISGLDDYQNGKPDIKLMDNHTETAYHILISHAPDLADRIDLSSVNLMLSGHTHGGQVNLPFARDYVLPPGGQKYVKGMYELNQNACLFVTSGIGTAKARYRFLNLPEIVVIKDDAK